MHSPCDPPKFVEEDFSDFDFSRWHLDGLTLDSAAEAFVGLTDRLFNSEEWQQHFKATLPDLQVQALAAFKDHSSQLREQRTATIRDFDKRVAAAQQRSDDFSKSFQTVGPPTVQSVRDAFQMVVRVVDDKEPGIGLPGLVVQMIDPLDEKAVLVESITDHEGNAVLSVPTDLTKKRDKRDTTLQVLDPAGKPLVSLPDGVCIRLGQTETKVVEVGETPVIAEHKKAALQIRADRETRARQLAGRAAVLKKELEKRVKGLDCRLRDNDAIIAEIEKPQTTDSTAEPPQETDSSKEAKTSEKAPPASSPKRRKK